MPSEGLLQPCQALRACACAALALAPALAFSAVDPDCFWGKESIACALDRVDDAKMADTLVEPVLAKAGWKHGCYRVLFIKGTNGGPDTLLVAVDGPRGGSAPGCTIPTAAELTPAETQRILDRGGTFQDVMNATSEKSIREGKAEGRHRRTAETSGWPSRRPSWRRPSRSRVDY